MVKFKIFFLNFIAIDFLEEKGADKNLTHTRFSLRLFNIIDCDKIIVKFHSGKGN